MRQITCYCPWLKKLSQAQLGGLAVASSVLLSELLVSVMGMLIKGYLPPDYLLVGLITSIFVSAIVAPLLISSVHAQGSDTLRLRVSEHAHLLNLEQELSEAIINSPAAIFYIVDVQGKFLHWNHRLEQVSGYTPSEIAGLSPLHFFAQAAQPAVAAVTLETFETGVSSLEADLRTKDGQFVPYFFSCHRMLIDGQPYKVGFGFDITQRKHTESALRESQARWRFALEGGGDCIWEWDVASDQLLLSEMGKKMFGFSDGEMSNDMRSWQTRVHQEDAAKLVRDTLEYFTKKVPSFSSEYRVLCKDGTWKWVHTRGIAVSHDTEGKITRMFGVFTDIHARKLAEETIQHQANYDPLTLLPNRRLFRDRLDQQIKSAQRMSASFALMLIDLDQFKEVNDTLGHDMGDILLIEAAERIKNCVRQSDTVARLGGDEFTVILSDLDVLSSADRIAQQILSRLSEPFALAREVVFVSASIGITLYPNDASDIDTLLKNADQAMYVAKHGGRNRFSYFTAELQQAAQKRMRLIHDLRGALAHQQFVVHYQPIIELATGRIHKAEALVRWQHPQRGLVSPNEFISLAEETGLIVEIGDWVFQQAAQQVRHWRIAHDPTFQVSVNRSSAQFNHTSSRRGVWLRYMQEIGLDASAIAVEITESLLLDTQDHVQEKLNAFREAGVQVALDDFGTGYSSLAYLKKFHIDYLKIDQSFVRDLAHDSDDVAVCEAIIVMAHKLGLKVVAEGVETSLQRDVLWRAGCDYAQGYLFSTPVSASEFETLLQRVE